MRWGRLSAVFVLAIAAFSSSAFADDKVVCATASENGQKLRDDGKLIKARQEFLVCARDVCPGTIKRDCADWLAQADSNTPSVVLSAKDAHGQDLASAKVTLDGVAADETLQGKAINIDPGPHTFKFEIPGEKPVDQQIVVREGEKNRVVSVSWQKAEVTPPPPPLTPPPTEPETKKSKLPAILVGGIGVVAIGTGAVFYALASGDFNDLKDTCGKTKSCTDDQVAPIKTKVLVSDIAFGVGVVAIGTAVVLYITESGSSPAHAQVGSAPKKHQQTGFITAPKFDFAPLPGGGAAMLGGRF
ncbi:MAG: hypothetical protein ABI461_18880 [Polyangiaceae bacterium]